MSDITDDPQQAATGPRPKSRFRPVALGLVAGAGLGGAAFYAVYSGLVLGPAPDATMQPQQMQDFAFIGIDPIILSLPPQSGARALRFAGQIEVTEGSHADMVRLHPRFVDLILLYLHAVEIEDLRQPAALIRLRSQILRRLQLIAGDGHIRDFLITEFVLD